MGVSDASYYNWRKWFGSMGKSQLSELRNLEKENARLKKIVAELELDKLILKESLHCQKPRGLTASQLRQAVIHTRQKLATSERRTCGVIGLARSSMQYKAVSR